VGINGPNGKGNILLSYLTANPDHGFLAVQNADGASRADIFVNAQSEGVIRVANAAGQFGAVLTAGNNGGLVSVTNADGNVNGLISAGSGGGLVSASDAAGNVGGLLSTGSNGGIVSAGRGSAIGALMAMGSNGGSLSVLDKNGNVKVGLLITASNQGRIFADVKNFVVDHPLRPGLQIVYASLEGPEAAIYHRGIVGLSNGRAIIELPEHFTALASPGTLTVQLTPESLDSEGLGFRRVDASHLEVRELHHGQGTYDVHFLVHAVRHGYEDYEPVVAKGAAPGAGGAAGGERDVELAAARTALAAAVAAQRAAELDAQSQQRPVR
jgi:hypothetical protein